jgi:hypothetical protein
VIRTLSKIGLFVGSPLGACFTVYLKKEYLLAKDFLTLGFA